MAFILIEIDNIPSTNTFAKELLKSKQSNWTTVLTNKQLAGRGQQGKNWLSEPYKNLTFSIILYPKLPIQQAYLLNQITALAVKDIVKINLNLDKQVCIKWPNDILVETRKIAGLLVETSVLGESLESCVIGIGLNVNQNQFKDVYNRQPTSLAIENNMEYELKPILKGIVNKLQYYFELIHFDNAIIQNEYKNALYLLNKETIFYKNETAFKGTIFDIDEYGRLKIRTNENTITTYNPQEIVYTE